jgi:hypothetical protein
VLCAVGCGVVCVCLHGMCCGWRGASGDALAVWGGKHDTAEHGLGATLCVWIHAHVVMQAGAGCMGLSAAAATQRAAALCDYESAILHSA